MRAVTTRERFAAIALAAALLLPVPADAAATRDGFSRVIEDLPLMQGLQEDQEASAVFDTPQGRIATSLTHGAVSEEAVREFYGGAMPALGWVRSGDRSFVRGGERLLIDIGPGDGGLTVRFTVSPD